MGNRTGGPAADKEKTRALLEWLVARFEEYVSEEETGYLEGLMAAHNFHKAIVLDQVVRLKEGGGSTEQLRAFLTAMQDTWEEAIERELRKLGQ